MIRAVGWKRAEAVRGGENRIPALEGEALTAHPGGCSNPLYRAAGGAVAKERAGGMHRRISEPATLARALREARRATPGARR
jgi:hypothetical protein